MIFRRLNNKFLSSYLITVLLVAGCAPKELTRAKELFNQASAYRLNGEEEQAIQAYRESVEGFQKIIEEETKNPESPGNLKVIAQAYALLAFAQIELGEFEEAEASIQQGSAFMLNANPRERELFFIMGGILQTAKAAKLNEKGKGRFQQDVVDLYKEAAATFETLRKMPWVDPNSEVLIYAIEAEAISYGNIATEYVVDFQFTKGASSLDKAIEYLQKAKEILGTVTDNTRPYTQYLLNEYTRDLDLVIKKRKEIPS